MQAIALEDGRAIITRDGRPVPLELDTFEDVADAEDFIDWCKDAGWPKLSGDMPWDRRLVSEWRREREYEQQAAAWEHNLER